MNDTPLSIINDWLADEGLKTVRQKYPADHWRASSAGYCMRRVFYERKQIPRTKKDDERSLRVLSAGNIFHNWAQDIVLAHFSGQETHRERVISIPDLNVVGRVDNVLPLTQGWTLIDYKSQHSQSFWHGKRNGGMLKPHQRLQIGSYLMALQGEFPNIGALICYISKDDLTMEQVPVPWDESLKADVLAYWMAINGYWERDEIPPCTCQWEVKYCPYHDGESCCAIQSAAQ